MKTLLSPSDPAYYYNGKTDPPKGDPKSGVFIVDTSNHSFGDVTADDNGAYINEGSPSNTLYFNGFEASKVHFIEGSWIRKERTGNKYVEVKVSSEDVYILTRTYRRHKANKQFTSIICRVKSAFTNSYGKYLLEINKLDENTTDEFSLPCHGNSKSKNKKATPYMRTSPTTLNLIKNDITKGSSPQATYDIAIKEAGGPMQCSSQSMEPRDIRQV